MQKRTPAYPSATPYSTIVPVSMNGKLVLPLVWTPFNHFLVHN